MDVHVGPDGSVYVSGRGGRVTRITPDGQQQTGIGGATSGSAGDGGVATAATASPGGLAMGPDGSLYMSDFAENNVRWVRADGILTILAGPPAGSENENTLATEYGGDTGPATLAQLYYPLGLALAPDGSLYIADTQNNRVRKVAPPMPWLPTGTTYIPSADGDRRLHGQLEDHHPYESRRAAGDDGARCARAADADAGWRLGRHAHQL